MILPISPIFETLKSKTLNSFQGKVSDEDAGNLKKYLRQTPEDRDYETTTFAWKSISSE